MAGSITFIEAQGGLGRQLPGQDYISGLLFYSASLPSGFSTTNRVRQIFSVVQAEQLGITNTYSDETKATATITISAAGTLGNILTVKVAEPKGDVTLAEYAITAANLAAGTPVNDIATSIAAAINLYTYVHGYTASAATNVITLTARAGLGIYLNTATKLTAISNGTTTATIADFAGGVASKLAVYHYHIAEYFRIQPQGNLFVGIFTVPAPYVFTEVQTMQTYANGTIRQIGVYKDGAAFATADIQALQAVANTLKAAKQWISILYGADISGIADATSLTTLVGLNSPNVTAVIGQDGQQTNQDGSISSGLGYELFKAYGKSITCLGATLGAVSLSQVSECIGNPLEFNITNGTELAIPALANGQVVKQISPNLLTQLDAYRYVYLYKEIGDAGTYHQDSHTSVIQSSDYAYIENVRTINKAERLLNTAYFPYKMYKWRLNSDGTLSDTSVAALENIGDESLNAMLTDGDLSDRATIVDPAQPVQSTGKIQVAVKLLAQPIGRNIEITIGFVLSIS
jgi:hypothetical protein